MGYGRDTEVRGGDDYFVRWYLPPTRLGVAGKFMFRRFQVIAVVTKKEDVTDISQ